MLGGVVLRKSLSRWPFWDSGDCWEVSFSGTTFPGGYVGCTEHAGGRTLILGVKAK